MYALPVLMAQCTAPSPGSDRNDCLSAGVHRRTPHGASSGRVHGASNNGEGLVRQKPETLRRHTLLTAAAGSRDVAASFSFNCCCEQQGRSGVTFFLLLLRQQRSAEQVGKLHSVLSVCCAFCRQYGAHCASTCHVCGASTSRAAAVRKAPAQVEEYRSCTLTASKWAVCMPWFGGHRKTSWSTTTLVSSAMSV